MNDTIAAVATSGGPIGIIRVSGEQAIGAVSAVFAPKNGSSLADAASQKLVYGTLFDKSGHLLDACYAVVFRAPHTYTGENMAEIQCHGSTAVMTAALDALFAHGVRQAEAGEFTRRAFLDGKMGLSEAEAVHDLITSRTVEAAQNAAAQMMGAVGSPVQQMRENLLGMVAHFHAVVDFPDEDIDPVLFDDAAALLHKTTSQLYRMAESYERGRILREGVPCVILGRPNAGKSTLLEAMMSKYEERDEEEPGMLYDGTEAYKIYANVLPEHIKLIETQKPEKHFFFRAESFFNHAAELDRQAQLELRKYSRIYAYKAYGGRSLLEQSHGESFLSAFLNYASRNTLFILDEPEAALSPQRQLALLVRIHELVNNGCQLIISTHSPILMAYPNADIYAIDDTGAHVTPYEETEHYQLTKYFLTHTEQMMKELLG